MHKALDIFICFDYILVHDHYFTWSNAERWKNKLFNIFLPQCNRNFFSFMWNVKIFNQQEYTAVVTLTKLFSKLLEIIIRPSYQSFHSLFIKLSQNLSSFAFFSQSLVWQPLLDTLIKSAERLGNINQLIGNWKLPKKIGGV